MNLENLKRRIAFILALSIPLTLTGCKDDKNSKPEESKTLIGENLENITPEEITYFLSSISEITPIYNLEEIYLTEPELNALMYAADSIEECSNTSLDIEELYDSILKNSVDNKGLITITDDLDTNEKEKIDNIIKTSLKEILTKMLNNGNISLEDACVLKDLTIVIGKTNTDSCMHYNSSTKLLIIDYQKFIKLYDNIASEALRENVIKEGITRYLEYGLNYGRLQACDCRKEKGQVNEVISYGEVLDTLQRMTVSTSSINDLGNINKPIFESISRNDNRCTSVLLLLSVFKENRNIEDLTKSIFDCNLQGIYDFFGLTSNEEIEEFYRIAKTIDLLSDTSEYEDNYYRETKSTNTIDFRNHIGYAYKASIFKSTITDLMSYIANYRDLSKEEAIFLYKYVKSIVVNNTYTNTEETFSYEPNYVRNIIGIENIFFEFLSKFYSLTIEEIDDLYEDYYSFWDLKEGQKFHDIDYGRLINKFPLLQYIQANYSPINSYIEYFDESCRGK